MEAIVFRRALTLRTKRIILATVGVLGLVAGALVSVALATPGDTTLVCPHVANPIDGQQVTCTYRIEAAPATTTTLTMTTTTTAVPTTTTTTSPGAAYPTWATTGTNCSTLPVHTGDYHTSANEVIDGKRITGQLKVEDDNVQVKNSCVAGGITTYDGTYHSGLIVTDTDIGGSGCNGGEAIKFSKYTALRVRVHNFGDAFRVSGNDVTIKDSYARLCANPGDHGDGVQGYQGGTNVHIIHNTIDQSGLTQYVTAPVFIADGSKGVELRDNLLAGGGFTIRVYGTTKSTVADNKVVDHSWIDTPTFDGGPVNSSCGADAVDWTGNTLVTIDDDYRITSTVGDLACAS